LRFIENGPSIPDELLLARDQGRVVFFCGAGVSYEKAKLPDFFGLAERIIEKLGIPADSPAQKILNEARKIDKRTGVTGLISADRIFGLLERDFFVRDVEEAVASALKLDTAPDLTPHQTILDLATSQEGLVRLVTTNFDRLFDDCDRDLPTWKPSRLPNPLRAKEMNGIVYLHGRANQDYTGAEDGGFILSSSQFGRAYLSEGWATSFVKEIIDQYTVVFIGYSADDPPIHYLLEALNKTSGKNKIYAFQSGSKEESQARWLHKGAKAIPFGDNYSVLWQTLEAWAERARDPDLWYSALIDRAKQGPKKLLPHERGQVAHVVSTVEGLRKFSAGDEPPPAEWLCVFDPHRRYAKPGRSGYFFTESGAYIDPFDIYCLDSDVPPEKIDHEDNFANREVPTDSWDAFPLNRVDKLNLTSDNFPLLRGGYTLVASPLPKRLAQLGIWIAKVAHQPAAVWWAARQNSLHPSVQRDICREIEFSDCFSNSEIRLSWQYLFECWEKNKEKFHDVWYKITGEIKKYGWSHNLARRYSACFCPYLKVEHGNFFYAEPPSQKEEISRDQLISLKVIYPDSVPAIDIPPEWLPFIVAELRKNLEIALVLETEIDKFNGYQLKNISPIVPENSPGHGNYGRTRGLSGAVLHFSSVFKKLLLVDLAAAKRELLKWPTDDDTIFARLRVWAAGKSDLVPNDQFKNIIDELSDSAFWSEYHQRDLLLTLSSRWNALPADTRSKIEKRLLAGRLRWNGEDEDEFRKRWAWSILNRITWLDRKGCELCLDLQAETERLIVFDPDWKSEYSHQAVTSLESRSGFVRTNTEYSSLLSEPLPSILSKAYELRGRDSGTFEEKNPYAGLAKDRPVRAFAALRLAAKQQDFPEWAWRTFLNSTARQDDRPRFAAFIAEQLSRYSTKTLSTLLRPASYWLLETSKKITSQYPESFDKITNKLIQVLATEPKDSSSAIVRGNNKPDWTTEALNSPTGQIAQAIFHDPKQDNLKEGAGFPPDWLKHVEELLALTGELRCHALVVFLHQLNWFYVIDPEWTKNNLLSVLDSDITDDQDAFWGGFLQSAKTPCLDLYKILKPYLLKFAKSKNLTRRGYGSVLAGMILIGWGSIEEKSVSDDELRDALLNSDDEFRSHILWQIERWSSDTETKIKENWSSLAKKLLKDVWPRQKAVKSSLISERLCDLIFSSKELFPELAEAALPLLEKLNRDYVRLTELSPSKENGIIDQHPNKVLEILYTVLPDNVSAWPYDIGNIFDRIGQANESLKSDERLIELKRKWNSR
jgi:hypothetical protein